MSEKLKLPGRLVLVRHGQSLHNAALWHNDPEILAEYDELVANTENPHLAYPLTADGKEQAHQAREVLQNDPDTAEVLQHGSRYYSHFARAIQTAEILSGNNLDEWVKNELIGERGYGPFDISRYSDDTEEKRQLWQEYKDDYWGVDFGGEGEAIDSVSQRIGKFLQQVVDKDTVLASTHGEWMRAARHVIEGVDLAKLTSKNEDIPIWNATILEYEEVDGKLFRRYQYPYVANGKPLPGGAGKWLKIDR